MNPIVAGMMAFLGALALVGVEELIKSLCADPHRDLMFLMGPKESGKSELIAALKQEPFDKDRVGTGARMHDPDDDDMFSYGDNKTFCTMESGGEGNLIEMFSQRVAKYIGFKRPEYVLLTLVLDVGNISEETIVSLGEYLHHFKSVCEDKNKLWQKVFQFDYCKYFSENYQKGNWGFTIVGTHIGKRTQRMELALENLGRDLQKYSGKLRWVKGAGLFELSDAKQRDDVVRWVVKKLDQMHTENL